MNNTPVINYNIKVQNNIVLKEIPKINGNITNKRYVPKYIYGKWIYNEDGEVLWHRCKDFNYRGGNSGGWKSIKYPKLPHYYRLPEGQEKFVWESQRTDTWYTFNKPYSSKYQYDIEYNSNVEYDINLWNSKYKDRDYFEYDCDSD